MGASLAFWEAVVEDKTGFLRGIIDLLDSNDIRYCVIGGVGVNAYSEPIVTAELDILLNEVEVFRTLNIVGQKYPKSQEQSSWLLHDLGGSKLEVRLHAADDEQAPWLTRADRREVMDLMLPVAAPADLFAHACRRALDRQRRPSRRGMDFVNLRRLIDEFPELEAQLPTDLEMLVMGEDARSA